MAGTVQLSGTPTFNADGSCTIDSTGGDRVLALSASGLINATQGWCAARLKMGFPAATPPLSGPNVWNWGDPANATMLRLDYNDQGGADTTWTMASWVAGSEFSVSSAAQTFATGDHI